MNPTNLPPEEIDPGFNMSIFKKLINMLMDLLKKLGISFPMPM